MNTNINNLFNYTKNRIEKTNIIKNPYEYLYIENFIEDKFYDRLLNYINNTITKNKIYDKIKTTPPNAPNTPHEGTSKYIGMGKRYILYTYNYKDIRKKLDQSIYNLFNILINKEIQKIIFNKFTYVRKKEICDTFFSTIDYCTMKYDYPLHIDRNPKNITFVFYLADDNKNEHLGTMIYDKEKKYHTKVPFRKNTCLIFAPYGNPKPTYHRMKYENFKNNCKYRKSISFQYYNTGIDKYYTKSSELFKCKKL